MGKEKVVPAPVRKGARSRADVSPETLRQLNAGEIEAVTLSEILVVDFRQLWQAAVPEHAADGDALDPSIGIAGRMKLAGEMLRGCFGHDAFERFVGHRSDTVRGWAAYALGQTSDWPLAKLLKGISPLADDPNPGVREWAWIALRPRVAEELDDAIDRLAKWTKNKSANLRRYASEIVRPRGVWCEHLKELKADPARGLPILEPLRADAAKYVQDSVANWLNDASKTCPDWVRTLCARWKKDSKTPATERICKRALRTIG